MALAAVQRYGAAQSIHSAHDDGANSVPDYHTCAAQSHQKLELLIKNGKDHLIPIDSHPIFGNYGAYVALILRGRRLNGARSPLFNISRKSIQRAWLTKLRRDIKLTLMRDPLNPEIIDTFFCFKGAAKKQITIQTNKKRELLRIDVVVPEKKPIENQSIEDFLGSHMVQSVSTYKKDVNLQQNNIFDNRLQMLCSLLALTDKVIHFFVSFFSGFFGHQKELFATPPPLKYRPTIQPNAPALI